MISSSKKSLQTMAEEQAAASNEETVTLFLIPANTTEPVKKATDKQRAEKKGLDRARDKSKINTGPVFHGCKEIRKQKGFKTDAEFATFLLDRAQEVTCSPGEDKGDVSTSEEERAEEGDRVNEDYIPPVSVRAGCLNTPKLITKQVTAHGAVDAEPPPSTEKIEVQRNEPHHLHGIQHKDQEQKPEKSSPADQASWTPEASSVPPSYELELTPPASYNTRSKKIHLNETNAEENHSEDDTPETQDHNTAPTGETLILSPEATSIHSSSQELCKPKTYHCLTCGRVFPRHSSLKRHLVIHSGKRPFKCFICGRGFTQGGNLKTHMKVHRGELPKWTLIQEKREPKESPATVHVCGDCGMDFPEKHQLEEHRETHKKPYACPDCGKRFKHIKSVKMHTHIHSGDSPHLCSECGKSCVTIEVLKKHKLTHTAEKNYHCDQCGRAFLQFYNLNLHLKTHTGERSFLCSICGKSYSRADTLKVHLRVHTGENPYTCKICGKCFYYYQGYQAHVKIHDKKPKTATRPLGRPKQQLT
ncbi:gastrula zinc finger protein XlCGF26.1-like [Archocentrus centrarchus]|uniref:gastrula zinc finger protein XlCGF26.1-like n=1 Tax=Archocentrus centrarchus TaxID=63155 RepID=UPI0011E9EE40|nr:gastrula zinc finger protein XlCGF26.1-like [Archocentrus centrarchus]